MDGKALAAFITIALTMVVGFWRVASELGQIRLKIDLMWDAYIYDHPEVRPGGRRRNDPSMER